jgi:peroxiredoxin/Tfp pilus assembly protein PilF
VIMMSFARTAIVYAAIFVIGQLFFIVPLGATLQDLQVGMEVPSFSLTDLSGERKLLSDLVSEKLTVIIFWSTWSPNSEKELIKLNDLYRKYKSAGLSVVAINVDGQKPTDASIGKIRLIVEKLKLRVPVLVDSGLMTFHDYGVIAVPSSIVIDNNRIIRYELSGFPLVGSQEMFDFISSTIEAKKPADMAVSSAYKPDKNALRYFTMGKTALTSRSSAGTAEMWFKKAIEYDPKFAAPYLSLGRLYLQKNQAPLARGLFENVLSFEPGNQVALCELAKILIDNNKLDDGKVLIEKALHQNGTYPACYYYLGSVYAKGDKFAEAFNALDNAIELDPHDPEAYIYKGRVCEENGMLQQAADAYKRALELILKE